MPCNDLVGICRGKSPLGGARRGWEYNMRIDGTLDRY
jgi:hypothetical protein